MDGRVATVSRAEWWSRVLELVPRVLAVITAAGTAVWGIWASWQLSTDEGAFTGTAGLVAGLGMLVVITPLLAVVVAAVSYWWWTLLFTPVRRVLGRQ